MTRSPASRNRNRSRRGAPNRRVAAARRQPSGTNRVLLLGAGALVLASLVIALFAGSGGGGGDDGDETGSDQDAPNAVAGALGVGDDPAIGAPLPALGGEDLDGRPMTIEANGRPQVVVFLAHWCPHCRAEVPRVQAWLDGGGLPEDVELVSVATANDENRPNYPADEWLDEEGWTPPTLLDENGEAAEAAGVDGYPYWVFIDGDGDILARTSGELTTDQLDQATQAMTDTAT